MGKSRMRSFGMAAVLVFVAGAAHATGALFSPLEVSPAYGKALNSDLSYRALADSPATAALQIVRANAAVVNEKAATVDLNLGAGLDLTVRRVEAYRSESVLNIQVY